MLWERYLKAQVSDICIYSWYFLYGNEGEQGRGKERGKQRRKEGRRTTRDCTEGWYALWSLC